MSQASNLSEGMGLGRYRPYPEYKESSVEWLGEIPSHWNINRVKTLFSIKNGSTPRSNEPNYWDGDIAWATPDDLGQNRSTKLVETGRLITEEGYHSCGATLVPGGSIILSTRAPIGHIAIAGIYLCTNQGCRSLVRRFEFSSEFFYYQLLASRPLLQATGQGSTFKELGRSDLENIVVTNPTLREQGKIAKFLDHKTAEIDELIARKERLIELLQEKRATLITQSVTKGLDPTVPMKDSGVEWLGEIPTHWNTKKLIYVSESVGDGIHATPEYDDESDYYFINGNNLIDGSIIFTKSTRSVSEEEYQKYFIDLNENTILMSINGTIGNVALYKNEKIMLGKSAAYINCGERITREYLFFLLQSISLQEYFNYEVTGTTIHNLSLKSIRNSPVLMPPHTEQRAITHRLSLELAKIDSQLMNFEKSIKLLQEYRIALISAAVTGKIDVR